jgi:anti-sigma factor RsiW
MACGKYKEQISSMLDGELNASLSVALSAHMGLCEDCRGFHEHLSSLDDALRNASPDHVPALAARVKDRLSRRKNHRQRDFSMWRRVPAMAMIVLLALGLGNMMGRSISDLFTNGRTVASLEFIAPDSENSFSEVLLDLGAEENQQ